jgi:cytochrome c-type biogenesis protein CcmH
VDCDIPDKATVGRLMGWVILLLAAVASLGALWLTGVRGGALTAGAAALLVGAAGYAFQGQPRLPESIGTGSEKPPVIPLTEARHAFFGNFSGAEGWLTMAEALERIGKTEDAAGLLQNAVRRHPGDAQLWIGLGNALFDHSGTLTPPAVLAYQRAQALNPENPAPAFFYGLAMARSGETETAVAIWRAALQHAPADASWRPMIEAGIAALSGEASQAATGK